MISNTQYHKWLVTHHKHCCVGPQENTNCLISNTPQELTPGPSKVLVECHQGQSVKHFFFSFFFFYVDSILWVVPYSLPCPRCYSDHLVPSNTWKQHHDVCTLGCRLSVPEIRIVVIPKKSCPQSLQITEHLILHIISWGMYNHLLIYVSDTNYLHVYLQLLNYDHCSVSICVSQHMPQVLCPILNNLSQSSSACLSQSSSACRHTLTQPWNKLNFRWNMIFSINLFCHLVAAADNDGVLSTPSNTLSVFVD